LEIQFAGEQRSNWSGKRVFMFGEEQRFIRKKVEQKSKVNKIEVYDFPQEAAIAQESTLTKQIVPNWKAAFLLRLAGPVKSARLQTAVAGLSNRHICGR